MLAARRRARYGDVLALHGLWLCAAGRAPTDIAAALLGSRSSGYRTLGAYRQGPLGWAQDAPRRLLPPLRPTVLLPTLRRSLVARLKATPRAPGWGRTGWSCATRALTLQTTRGVVISGETMRRWLHDIGWVWQRANLVANDDDPHRVERVARIREVFEHLKRCAAMVFADELDIHRLPKVGCAWMPTGTPREVMTLGQSEPPDVAGARDPTTGTLHDALGPRKTTALFRDVRDVLAGRDPAEPDTRL
jgi:transposase